MTKTEYLLTCLIEECAEVSQRASKILRFGLTEVQPGQDLNNAERLVEEYVDLRAVWEMLEDRVTSLARIRADYLLQNKTEAKKAKVLKFMEYSRQQGTLEAKQP